MSQTVSQTEKVTVTHRHTEIDRLLDTLLGRQIITHTDRHMNRQKVTQVDRQVVTQIDRHVVRQIDRQIDRQRDRQRDRQIVRPDRESGTLSHRGMHI